jgi:tRNA-Thr(GGU) m(6)t(6)A37 methyltransferase TsaA
MTDNSKMDLVPIGLIHTPYSSRKDAPHQGRDSQEICEIELFSEYAHGLLDLERCTHLIVLYWLHLADRCCLIARPPRDGKEHGVFATRSPNRPNPIALDVVELLEVDGCRLVVRGMDALDGSTLLDIKPYSSGIDSIEGARIGWHEYARPS